MTPPPGLPTDRPQLTGTSPKTNHAEEARGLLYIPLTTTEEGEAALVTAADQTPATEPVHDERCEGRGLAGPVRTSCSCTYRAAHGHTTPATDSERDERCCDLGCEGGACEQCPCCEAGWCVSGSDGLPMDADGRARWLSVAAEHNVIASFLAERDAEVTRLTALLAEQAATIERLHDVGTGVIAHLYEGDCPVGPPFSPTKRDRDCPACTALGSQRTEGQG